MLILGFFFLLRPGEYAATDNLDSTPFRFQDVHLLINAHRLHPFTATEGELNQVNFIALEFTNQKNGVRGELIGLGRSGHPRWCPVYAILSRIRHLRAHNAALHTPIYQYFNNSWHSITSTMLTNQLRIAITALGSTYGIQPLDVSVRSLRASGAMALLSARVDTDVIRLLAGGVLMKCCDTCTSNPFHLSLPLLHKCCDKALTLSYLELLYMGNGRRQSSPNCNQHNWETLP
jgi:hypothetical protein